MKLCRSMLLFYALILLTVFAIGSIGCVGAGGTKVPLSQHQQIENVCITIAAGYAAAGELNARSPLSAKQQAQLTHASTVTDKVCENIPDSWLEVAPEFTKAAGEVAILSKGGTPP